MPFLLIGLFVGAVVIAAGLSHGAAVRARRLTDAYVDDAMPEHDREYLWESFNAGPPHEPATNPEFWMKLAGRYKLAGWPKAAAVCTQRGEFQRAVLEKGFV